MWFRITSRLSDWKVFDLGGTEVRESLSHVACLLLGHTYRRLKSLICFNPVSSSESQRYFELSLSSLDFIAQKRRGVSNEHGLRNQVWFPVIIHPFMCTALLLKFGNQKLLIYTPWTPIVIVTDHRPQQPSPQFLCDALRYGITTTLPFPE